VTLFGTSGIRGRYPEQVNEALFLRIGQALGSLFEEIVVGRDVRRSGKVLQEALMAGIAAAGSEAHDCGLVTTPTVAHTAAGFDCGAIVTASHNPPEYNGLKLWAPSGMAFDKELRSRVEDALRAEVVLADWRKVGSIWPYEGALQEHRERVVAAVGSSDVTVALDCGNGSTSLLTPYVLRDLGCEVVSLNCHPDGFFPGRGAEPTEEALEALRRSVTRSKCDVGIAHDGDGDRMVAVDENGRQVKAEKLLILFARVLGARKVVAPVDASMALEDVLGRDRVVRTRVGDVYVAEAILREDADLGGEPSCTWIFPDFALCPDGIYAAAYLCSVLQEGSLSELVADIPEYSILRESVAYDPSLDIVSALEEELASVDANDLARLDGWRLDFGDAWGLVRPSGTEPKVRITVEAREEERAREIYAALHSRVSRAIS
jgi:phosphoglucosamine mutase